MSSPEIPRSQLDPLGQSPILFDALIAEEEHACVFRTMLTMDDPGVAEQRTTARWPSGGGPPGRAGTEDGATAGRPRRTHPFVDLVRARSTELVGEPGTTPGSQSEERNKRCA